MSDIYQGAVVKAVRERPWHVEVTSYLKPGLASFKRDVIPLLVPAENFLFHLDRFRKEFDKVKLPATSRGSINKKWCLECVDGMVRNFQKPHHLRACYAKFAYLLFGQEEHEIFIPFHSNEKVALAYSQVCTNPKEPVDSRKSKRLFR